MAIVHNQRELGAAIRDRRQNLRWTQAALADKVGVTRDWVIDLEAGRGNPQLRHILRALDVLELRLTVDHGMKDEDATFDTKQAVDRPEGRIHRGLTVVDLDDVLDAHRRRG